jgi:DNA-binding transcriptional regulator YdaS (Cro superfamily)
MHLKTARQVCNALGGQDALCELLDATPKQVWNWVGRRSGRFPAHTYVKIQRALKRRRASAPAHLWSMTGVKKKRAA